MTEKITAERCEELAENCFSIDGGFHEEIAAALNELAELKRAQREPIGYLNIHNYRGLENKDFEYVGELPDGNYPLYLAQPTSAPAVPQWQPIEGNSDE